MRLIVLPVLAATVFAAGCGLSDDGPRTTQTRDVSTFTRVDNEDAVDLRLHAGSEQRVRVRGGEKVIDDIRTEVRDGTLHISFEHHGWGGGNIEVEAWVPELTAIAAGGSGDVNADGIKADALDVRSDGSADLHVTGTAGRLAVAVDGSGDADLAALPAREATVAVGGSGDVEVRAADKLNVKVDGSGDVRFHGDPALTQSVDGSGDIKRAS